MAIPPSILHIDAEPLARTMLARAFALGHMPGVLQSLSSASNALLYLNGLGPFKGFPRPILIMLDLDLPLFDGADFLPMLKANPRFKSIRTCILMTNLTEQGIERCRAMGADGFRPKPHSEEEAMEMMGWIKAWLLESLGDPSPGG